MIEWIKTRTTALCQTMWCHRAAYAGLAQAYGAGCAGWIDKDTVAQIVTGLYIAMVAQRH